MRRAVTSVRVVVGLMFVGLLFAVAPNARASAAPTVHQWVTPGTKWIHPVDLKPRDLVNGKLVTNVVLPPNYKSRKCWPVMYLLHGTAADPAPTGYAVSDQWLQMDNAALLKMKIPAILIVPGSGDSWWVNNWWNGARVLDWENWVLDYIVPLAQKRLHICAGRSEHSIAGLSMGGYGAMYLASQRPSYFGSVGSFSGVLSPESPNFLSIYPSFPTIWGPADHFYAIGHDPLALVRNLRNTRAFVAAGNGVPVDGETSAPVAVFEEEEFDQESLAFTAKARRAHVSVTFDQHAGTHDGPNWIQSLVDMLRWNPFKRVVKQPKNWTFDTVESYGDAWGYRFSFPYKVPKAVVQFSSVHGEILARGAGPVTMTLPDGRRLTGRIPFDIRHGRLIELKHAAKPHVVGGYQKLEKVSAAVTQAPATATSPIVVGFKTTQALPRNEEYQVALLSISTTSSCQDTVGARVYQPAKDKTVSVSLSPPVTATTPETWCAGPAYVGVTEVPKGAPPELGNILDYTATTLP